MFFFFKQKTAYEMRISDWSSDVCSSDRHRAAFGDQRQNGRHPQVPQLQQARCRGCHGAVATGDAVWGDRTHRELIRIPVPRLRHGRGLTHAPAYGRSEEHTSELQSLMRISYAVFRLTTTHKVTTSLLH